MAKRTQLMRTSTARTGTARTGTARTGTAAARKPVKAASSTRTPVVKLSAKSAAKAGKAKKTGKATKASTPTRALALRGGRTLQVRTAGSSGRETIELKSRDGALELKITMTPDGPMIHVKGGSLAVEAADAVSVACKRFEVQASGGINFAAGEVSVESGGEMRLRSQGPTRMDSEVLHLNCGDRSAYPPPPEFVMPAPVAPLPAKTEATHDDGCGCDEHHHRRETRASGVESMDPRGSSCSF